MITTKKVVGILLAPSLLALVACGSSHKPAAADMAMGGGDMAQPSCVMMPTSPTEILNGCTTSQTGDPQKDSPYFPSLTPGGNLPPLP
jgi:hypothetical protein